MERFFNTAGPVNPEMHYALDPLDRVDLNELSLFIAQKKYIVLHAPRQTGKTSALLALRNSLNAGGEVRCLYANVESGQSAGSNVDAAMDAILREMANGAREQLDDSFLDEYDHSPRRARTGHALLGDALSAWCPRLALPLVLLLDEIDSLVGDSLVSLLRQLRAGYAKRPDFFPSTVVLCGVRDVRDYRFTRTDGEVVFGGSAFNVKAESLRLGDFSKEEIAALYAQHTEATGQAFEEDVAEFVWEETRGQPWLVNALAYEVFFRTPEGRARSRPSSREDFVKARELLILRRDTHLDQLADKLKEPRVRRVIQPLLASGMSTPEFRDEDVQYTVDLGLVARSPNGELSIANGIYREIIPREIVQGMQYGIVQQTSWYLLPDGKLNFGALLDAFVHFFREHSEHWLERFDYKEAGPQLLLQAFLQRIVNGGGRVQREYGLGRMRTDIYVEWPYSGGVQRIVLELKLLRGSLEKTVADGVRQTWEYADRCGADEAHLIVFDRTPGKSREEKIFLRSEVYEGRTITVRGV